MHGSLRIPAVTLALAIVACDDGPTEPARTGYDVTVSGDIAARARGQAFFGSDTDETGAPIFGIVLGSDTSSHTILMAKEGTDAPGRGEYRIRTPGTGGAGWDAAYILSEGDELLGVLVADSGRIVITESSASRLSGTIDLWATGLVEDGEMTQVRLSGTFTALPAPAAVAAAQARSRSF